MGRRQKRNKGSKDSSSNMVKQGIIGTLRKAAKSLGRRMSFKKDIQQEPEPACSNQVQGPVSHKMAPMNNQMFQNLMIKSSASIENMQKLSEFKTDELSLRCERLKEELRLITESLDETRELFDNLHRDLTKVREKLYCMDSMQDPRYEFLKSYIPEAKEQLRVEKEKHAHTRQVLASRLGCEPEDLRSVLQQGRRATTQTYIVPDNILEQLSVYDQQACEDHVTLMIDCINDEQEKKVARGKELQDIKQKQSLELKARMWRREQLQYRLNALERQQDVAKRV